MPSCIGKTALVTNASAGIGRAVAIALGAAGAQVLVQHSRSPVAAEQVVDAIAAAGGRAKAVAVDLAAPAGPQELAEQVRKIIGDRLDIFVFNAKHARAVSLGATTAEHFDAEFAANVRVPFFLVQELLPVMNSGSCLIFTLSSPAATALDVDTLAVLGSLGGLVDQLAMSLKSRGVRVDAILPAAAGAARRQGYREGAGPSDIARAVTALAASPA